MTITETEQQTRDRLSDTRWRADLLTGIASKWDRTLFLSEDTGRDIRFALNHMTRAAMEYAHPLLSHSDVQQLMETLRDALNARVAYLDYGVTPYGIDPILTGLLWVAEVVELDVKDALWPLLTGLSTAHACLSCRREPVWEWQTRVQGRTCGGHS